MHKKIRTFLNEIERLLSLFLPKSLNFTISPSVSYVSQDLSKKLASLYRLSLNASSKTVNAIQGFPRFIGWFPRFIGAFPNYNFHS